MPLTRRAFSTQMVRQGYFPNTAILFLLLGGYLELDPCPATRMIPLAIAGLIGVLIFVLSLPIFLPLFFPRLMAVLDRDGVFESDLEATAVMNETLRGPWLVAACVTALWIFVGVGTCVGVEHFTVGSGPQHPFLYLVIMELILIPAIYLINLMLFDFLMKPYAALSESRAEVRNSWLRLTVTKRLYMSLFVLGPQLLISKILMHNYLVSQCKDLKEGLICLTRLETGAAIVSIELAVLFGYYMTRSIGRPLQQLISALTTGDEQRESPLVVDEFGVVARLLRERQRIERAKQEFLSMVSHDLRSPLMSVHGFCRLLHGGSYGEVSEEAKQKASQAERNVRRLMKMINEVLDADKLDSGRLECVPSETSSATIIERAVDAVRELAAIEQVEIRQEVEDIELLADEERTVQILVNLISNCIRYAGKQPIVVSAKPCAAGVEFAVQDRGPGIAREDQPKLFDRYFQIEKGSKSGSGLGLSIAKTLVELQGGELGLDSELGKGCRFWFTLPASTVTAPNVAEVSAST